ncbi:unnamed protein product [Penicillium camemberti]|uniref:Str. FM013 n=1 Tax=Penicillium camemberti (strain FM 013) TaxID=1429867 RepID=A0A0G4P4A2_PENC3|nr:unnamed protein product [Penicillium camemberti]
MTPSHHSMRGYNYKVLLDKNLVPLATPVPRANGSTV